MEPLNTLAIAEQISSQMTPRLESLGMSPQEAYEDADILQEFNKIAAGMLQENPQIEMPGGGGALPMDEKMVHQGISLFAEGVYFAMLKCLEMGITGDVKKQLLQNLAMDIYNQACQVVASTYGQEHTPDFQFTFQQQVDLINQGAESALIYYIGEYEREHGPIAVEEMPTRLLPKVEQAMVEDGVPLPDMVAPAQPIGNAPKGPTPHDKYGAVALLLNALPADQRGRILNNFNPEEKDLITFYSYPQHIEQNLDMASVESHLKQFKELLRQGGPTLKSAAFQGIATLAQSITKEKLLSYVKDERPVVRQYLESHYTDTDSDVPDGNVATARARHLSNLLPTRIEEILYRYLAKRVEAHG